VSTCSWSVSRQVCAQQARFLSCLLVKGSCACKWCSDHLESALNLDLELIDGKSHWILYEYCNSTGQMLADSRTTSVVCWERTTCGCTVAKIELLKVPGTAFWLVSLASRSNLDLRALFESCWRNRTTEPGPYFCYKLYKINRIVDLNRPIELLLNCFNYDPPGPMRMHLKTLRRCDGGSNWIKYQPVGQQQNVKNQINHFQWSLYRDDWGPGRGPESWDWNILIPN
jgi:hypothetical protein